MTRFDLRALETFRTAAKLNSFSRAAERLGMVQSSVTEQVKGLEAILGARLFDRNGRGVSMTSAGETLLGYAESLLSLAEEAEAAMRPRKELSGVVTIGAAETLCTYRLPPLLKAYRERHPLVAVRFVPTSVRVLKRHVAERRFDLAFVLEEPFEQEGLGREQLAAENVVVIASPDHLLVQAATVRAQDLVGESVFLTEPGCDYRNRFERALIKAGAHPGQGSELYSIETVKACVAMGLGIAPLPKVAVAREITEGKLVALAWDEGPLDVASHLVWNAQRGLSPAAEAFKAMAVGMLGDPNFKKEIISDQVAALV
jgi:DNA-binding transcriptional LysR family regulator